MIDYCANPKCGKGLIHVQGRKKKKYCDATCKLKHWQQLNPVKKEKKFVQVPVEKYSEMELAQLKLKELMSRPFWTPPPKATCIDISDLTKPTNVVEPKKPMGSEITNTVINTTPNPNQSLISQYEKELSTLGDGSFARARKKWLNNKINQLKSGTI